jgi:hypothetical protein
MISRRVTWLVDRADGVSELHYEGSELVDLEIAVVGPQNTSLL